MTQTPNGFPKAIIFDMDGLLVDSEPVWLVAEVALIESRGKQYRHDIREQLVGKRMDEFMSIMREAHEIEDALEILISELTDTMAQKVAEQVDVRPGVAELLAYVVRNNIPRAIASSSPSKVIDAVVESRGWGDIFVIRCSADECERGKPAPDVYLLAAEKLGVHPDDCLTLEDSPNGARSAVAAGMVCYAVPDTSHSSAAALEAITPHVLNSLHDVLAKLERETVV